MEQNQPSNSREFVEYVAKLLARSPDDVQTTETVEDGVITYHLTLAPEDVGRVIGREGRIVRAIRSLLRSAAVRQGVRIVLEVG
jgi:predicted RNA-binding protein YlqC (UPF0109 family)